MQILWTNVSLSQQIDNIFRQIATSSTISSLYLEKFSEENSEFFREKSENKQIHQNLKKKNSKLWIFPGKVQK